VNNHILCLAVLLITIFGPEYFILLYIYYIFEYGIFILCPNSLSIIFLFLLLLLFIALDGLIFFYYLFIFLLLLTKLLLLISLTLFNR